MNCFENIELSNRTEFYIKSFLRGHSQITSLRREGIRYSLTQFPLRETKYCVTKGNQNLLKFYNVNMGPSINYIMQKPGFSEPYSICI